MALAVTFFLLINSAAEKFGKDDEWLIYMYIDGAKTWYHPTLKKAATEFIFYAKIILNNWKPKI